MLETKLIYKLALSFFHLFNLSIFIFLFMIIAKTQKDQVKDNSFVDDLMQNWFSKGIKEIYIPNHGEECESYFFSRTWEGIEPACDCRKSFHPGSRNLYKGKCSLYRLFIGCQSIKGAETLFTNKWKGAKLCVKHTDTNFFDSITVTDTKCPKKFTLCGVDSKNFPLCFPKTMGCSVNKIKITNGPLTTSHERKHFKSVILNDDWILHYSNTFHNETLTIDVKYSEGRVCLNPAETNLKLNYIKYKSENNHNNIISNNFTHTSSNCVTKIGKFYYDERYKNLDSVSKFKYYFDNDIMQTIEKFPQINSQELINYNVNLYQRGYIYWSPYCRQDKNLNPGKVVEDLLGVIKIEALFEFVGKFLLIIFGLYILVVIVDVIFRYFDDYFNLKTELKMFYNQYYRHAFNLFILILLCFAILLIFLLWILYDHRAITKKFNELKCGDYFTNITFNSLGKNLNDLFYYGAELFLGSLILLSVMIVNRLIL